MSIDREAAWMEAKKATGAADAQWRVLWQVAYDNAQNFGQGQPTHQGLTEIAMSFTRLAAYIPTVRAARKAEAAFRDMAEAVAMREKAKKMASRKQWHIEQNKTVLQQMLVLMWRDRSTGHVGGCKKEIYSLRGLAQQEEVNEAWHDNLTAALEKCMALPDLTAYDWHVISCVQVILDDTWVDGITS